MLADAEQGHQLFLGGVGKRVRRRDLVRNPVVFHVHVDTQHLAQEGFQVLAAFQRIAFPAAITGGDVEVAIGTEFNLAAVVVVVGLFNAHQHLGGLLGTLRRQEFRIVLVHLEADNEAVAVKRKRGIVDVKVAVFLEFRMERHRIQALFHKARLHIGTQRVDVGQIQERFGLDAAVFIDDADAPHAFGDEQAAGAVVGAGHVGRVQKPIGNLYQGDLRITRQHATGLSDFFDALRNLRTRRGPQHHGAGHDAGK